MLNNNFKSICTKNAPSPAGPYSQGIITDNFVFVSGQRPQDPATGEIKKDIKDQTYQVIKNIESILKEAGCSLKDVVRTTVYLSDIKYFDEMNSIYREMFNEPFPTRTTIGVQLRGIDVEIDAIALKK
ncbi:2-iminobutanoate/2-iminopropanoate deaminase [Keratinibaculum paraultunense]|uniref:2-iminobutanoate/2-iminopropanoate deaminase n=1 Tax=Keratinibaculum paraultunense TaxID=1278232 RepID=A0A4R3L0A7_9FIRM|nr:Rid family detoxifying hydrolase [Keratinibaculum paraultunense]QQY80075.1 reactive intermediate/imine deaminase [Keratinibaculum paraultunense]TCS91605.1 2-iminobutanoate/2-iminopropanoate deaminase [Keratinibaculum paraultunense]